MIQFSFSITNVMLSHHTHHNHITALFPGPPRWAGARRELLDFMVQGKINKGRYTDHPAGRHSILTKQCPPPPSPMLRWTVQKNLHLQQCWLIQTNISAGDNMQNATHSQDERHQLCTTGGSHLHASGVWMARRGHGRDHVSRLLLLWAGRHLWLRGTLTGSHRGRSRHWRCHWHTTEQASPILQQQSATLTEACHDRTSLINTPTTIRHIATKTHLTRAHSEESISATVSLLASSRSANVTLSPNPNPPKI